MFKLLLVPYIIFILVQADDSDRCDGLEEFDDIDCNYTPDDDLDSCQLIRKRGYPSESHIITTEDGYFLTMHRIPANKEGKKGHQPVFLQHGLFGSSADWLLNQNQSLAYQLADRGYDVWMGNARGNTYSRAHMSLSVSSEQYWNFSFHEMGVYDLPAAIGHIGKTTGKSRQIIYVGHSMGTTMFFVLASTKPHVAKAVKMMVALAPTAYMTHVSAPLIINTAPYVSKLEWLTETLGLHELVPNNAVSQLLSDSCDFITTIRICKHLLLASFGFDKGEFNTRILPAVLAHTPAGASTKTLIHYAQEVQHGGNFQQFDYGKECNKNHYGTPTPPGYNVSNIHVPIFLAYAKNDLFANPIDVKRFSEQIPHVAKVCEIPRHGFNHLDFLYARDLHNLVNKYVIEGMPGEIIYIGYSMGTTMYFIMSSLLPEVAKDIKMMIGLAPVAYVTYVTARIRILALYGPPLEWVDENLSLDEIAPNYEWMQLLADGCDLEYTTRICSNVVLVTFGFDGGEFNTKILPAFLTHVPAGASSKTLTHYAQEINNKGNFQWYDYGPIRNPFYYHSLTPPRYNTTNIQTSIYLMYSRNDSLATAPDVIRLSNELPNLVEAHQIQRDGFNHLDFQFGRDTEELVNEPVFDIMEQFKYN